MHRMLSFAHLSTAVCLSLWLCLQLTTPVAAQERVRAKVGIQVLSSERSALAKATEAVKAGDSFRVYVIPEDNAYVYVVRNDGKTLTLLNAQDAQTQVRKGTLVILPAPEKSYPINGTSVTESITVICSPTEIREVTTLFHTTNVPQKNWLSLEQELMGKSKIDLTQKADKPFQIVGNVRGMYDKAFVDTLQIFSGKAYVVKKYDLQVQK